MRSWKIFATGLVMLSVAAPLGWYAWIWPWLGLACVGVVVAAVALMQMGGIQADPAVEAISDLCPDDVVKLSQGLVRARFGVHWLMFEWDAEHHCLVQR
jgi:hypothetical protein